MEIRQMILSEADDVSRIYAASWKAAYRGIVPQAYLDGLNELRWSPIIARNPSNSYVLLEGGRPIGTSSIVPARDEKMAGWGEIISVYILPEHWGKGYGRALMDFDIKVLASDGFRSIYLWALEKNARARAFYEKYGFRHDGGTISCDIGGESLTEVRYTYFINQFKEVPN